MVDRSGEVCVNGAAARLVEVDDEIIIAAYAVCDEQEVEKHRPTIVVLDSSNRITRRL